MCLVFTRMPGESYRRRLRSLYLFWCYVFGVLINSLVCCSFGRKLNFAGKENCVLRHQLIMQPIIRVILRDIDTKLAEE